MRPLEVWDVRLGRAQETWVPKPQNDARRQLGLPFGVRGDNPIHQRENLLWLVLHLYVNVEFDMLIFWLLIESNL